MSRLYLGLGCLYLLAGCAAKPHMPGPGELAPLPVGTGVVIGSMARATTLSNYDGYEVRFVDVTRRGTLQYESIAMRHPPDDSTFDFREPDRDGDTFAFVLPAGEYVLYYATAFSFTGRFESQKNLHIPFT